MDIIWIWFDNNNSSFRRTLCCYICWTYISLQRVNIYLFLHGAPGRGEKAAAAAAKSGHSSNGQHGALNNLDITLYMYMYICSFSAPAWRMAMSMADLKTWTNAQQRAGRGWVIYAVVGRDGRLSPGDNLAGLRG